MNIKCKIPYNFQYGQEIMEYLVENKKLVDSVYFSFDKGSRPIKSMQGSRYYHLKRLDEIKEVLDCKLNFVINSVIPVEIGDFEEVVLESGLIDIITIARDDVFKEISKAVEKTGCSIKYEVSRFYKHIESNKGKLAESASIFTYGFEHEITEKKKENTQLCFIANERCYPHCQYKIKHNTNVLLRNRGKTDEKFSCPYKEKRKLYSTDFVNEVCRKYDVDLLKLCDRTMSDDELLDVYKLWFGNVKKWNREGIVNV